jgi:hypothetical protein
MFWPPPGAGNIDAEALELLAAREIHFQHEFIGTAEIPRGAIEGDEYRHLGSQALFVIGRLERTTLDVHGAVRRRGHEPNGRQRTRRTVRPDIAVDGDAHFFPRRRLDLALGDIALRHGGTGRHAKDCRGEPETAPCQHGVTMGCGRIAHAFRRPFFTTRGRRFAPKSIGASTVLPEKRLPLLRIMF